MNEPREITLGEHPLPVLPQRWKKITKRLGRVIDAFRGAVDESGEFDAESFVGILGERTYYTLITFIPDLKGRMPEYEFAGYGSREAFDNDEYDEDRDKSPTFPQLLDAFDVIVEVNGGKRFMDMLSKVFDPKMLKAEMSLALSEWRENSLSIGSPNSHGTNGESAPTSSTPSGTTSAPASGSQEIEHLDFAPRREWMPDQSGEPLTTSG